MGLPPPPFLQTGFHTHLAKVLPPRAIVMNKTNQVSAVYLERRADREASAYSAAERSYAKRKTSQVEPYMLL